MTYLRDVQVDWVAIAYLQDANFEYGDEILAALESSSAIQAE